MLRLRIALGGAVTLVWVLDYVIAYVTKGETHDALTGLMAIVLGWVFSGSFRELRRRNGNSN
jgi:hypothetical protein